MPGRALLKEDGPCKGHFPVDIFRLYAKRLWR
ncbi:hypothetical protein V475_13080 [Sphingobium baderi LL03]|uniref:Uncharacterized protein n=1 Tax=Sphingobium baderi LL03 TaxID=1114964 RepID=T0HLK7_9SPHN|nr:hypothetical protein L485_17375 [Sphingobium baderi LL03]KMS61555.1 hypothetical protein V475_13080 [Sphingobium baderi LL03]